MNGDFLRELLDIMSGLAYNIGALVGHITRFLKYRCGMHEMWIYILLSIVPLYFLGFVTERIRNFYHAVRDSFYWFVNGYYRVLYMMNPGFRRVLTSTFYLLYNF